MAKLLGGADISMPIGLLVAAGVYLVLCRSLDLTAERDRVAVADAGLGKLDEHGNLRATSDFRGLYSALLEQWLDADAEAIIPNARKFARPKVIR